MASYGALEGLGPAVADVCLWRAGAVEVEALHGAEKRAAAGEVLVPAADQVVLEMKIRQVPWHLGAAKTIFALPARAVLQLLADLAQVAHEGWTKQTVVGCAVRQLRMGKCGSCSTGQGEEARACLAALGQTVGAVL